MPNFMNLPVGSSRRLMTQTFTGYDHRLKGAEGSFFETRNLSLERFPLLSTRRPRGIVETLRDPGGLIAKDALCYVDGGTLYVNRHPTALTGLLPGEKQLVSMGAYVLIFPDKVYYNTEDPSDFGSMEADLEFSGEISYRLCDQDGQLWEDPVVSADPPEAPPNGALWLDSGSGTLLRYSQVQMLWVEVPTVYTRITLPSLGRLTGLFSRYDGVTITGAAAEELNGEKILYALGGGDSEADWVAVVGLIPAAFTQTGTLRLRRTLPQMDYLCQAGNRLWGCRYGNDGSGNINEIYGSALGDFKNFRQFLGLATDSWAGSVGSDGQWTGAVDYLGEPCFFKEDRIHVLSIAADGAHRLSEIPCHGVQKGSHKSLQVVGETLYYKAPGEVCAWQGGFPQTVSQALGEERYGQAVGGALDGRYYLSMASETGWSLFCYDTGLNLWVREDELHALGFASTGEQLWCIDADSGKLLALRGGEGEAEPTFDWSAESGPMRYETTDRKYLSRIDLSLSLEKGASLGVWLRYDSRGDWIPGGLLRSPGSETVVFPVRPRRCDHVQLRLKGRGGVTVYALSRILETGSDH